MCTSCCQNYYSLNSRTTFYISPCVLCVCGELITNLVKPAQKYLIMWCFFPFNLSLSPFIPPVSPSLYFSSVPDKTSMPSLWAHHNLYAVSDFQQNQFLTHPSLRWPPAFPPFLNVFFQACFLSCILLLSHTIVLHGWYISCYTLQKEFYEYHSIWIHENRTKTSVRGVSASPVVQI